MPQSMSEHEQVVPHRACGPDKAAQLPTGTRLPFKEKNFDILLANFETIKIHFVIQKISYSNTFLLNHLSSAKKKP